ncbi:rod shape-determining protein MreC [Treponema parvum]|uniref:Cell shape-determining protein MreC n=1 Tax=Treponema parvum TaxID=138851 RepID=A0A975ICM5_9SPIR|nr:rod shape-determining protein MreC [Treponema parvum]QTQ11878.1 rod shape-determining protein MreC [Treponema parvum]
MSKKKNFLFNIDFSEFLFIVFFLFSGVMLAFSSQSFVLNFNKIGFTVLSTIQKGVYSVVSGIENSVNAVKEVSRLKADYNVLTEKLKDFEAMQRSNAEIRKENERLRALLDFSESLEQKNIPAHIIGRDIDGLYASMTINKGSVHGIRKNLPVIAIQNGNPGIVGKITSVGRYTSQLMPVYDVKCAVSARIQNTRDIGLATGQGTFSSPLKLQYIRKRVLEDLHYGDIVVTSGENDNYIGNIPIGTISKITVIDYDSSLNIDLNPAIDFMRLEDVLVIDLTMAKDKKD